MQKSSKIVQNFLLFSILFFYVIILFVFLIKTADFFDASREINRSINLIPFHSIIDYLFGEDVGQRGFSFMNVFGNIILFIPLGIYLPLLKCDKRIGINTLWIFFTSLSVEIIQYIFGIGASDIDDIILNTVGGFIGGAIYKVLLYLLKDEDKTRFVITIVSVIIAVPVLYLFTHLKIRIR